MTRSSYFTRMVGSRLALGATLIGLLFAGSAIAQKPPLDHDVYDGWERISTAGLSKDGRTVYYVVSPQEGDSRLYVKEVRSNRLIGSVDRPASVTFTPSQEHLVFLIKPLFSETREARIQKKRGNDLPKDTLAFFSLETGEVTRIPAVRNFKTPEEQGQFIAYMMEQPSPEEASSKDTTAQQTEPNEESATRRTRSRNARPETVLVLHHLTQGVDTTFQRVESYFFSKDGQHLYFVRKAADKDSVGLDAGIVHYNLATREGKQISSGKGSYKALTFDDDGQQLAFLAYKGDDKAQNKVHQIYHYRLGGDSARVLIDARTPGIPDGWQVGEHGSLRFTADGQRLFLGLAPEPLLPDTNLVEFEHAKVDIWHWKDDYLQTQQLVNLRRDRNRTYTAVVNLDQAPRVLPLADESMPDLRIALQGDQEFGMGTSDVGRRIATQWEGSVGQDIYIVSTRTGERRMIKSNLRGGPLLSPEGKYIVWFDRSDGNWYAHDIAKRLTRLLNGDIPIGFANEDHDAPDDPNGYGLAGWGEGDHQVFIYDKYDLWMFDLENHTHRSMTNGFGRLNQITLRYQNLDGASGRGAMRRRGSYEPIDPDQPMWLAAFDHQTKENGWYRTHRRAGRNPQEIVMGPYTYRDARGAEEADVIIYTKENYVQPPDLYVSDDFRRETRLSAINPQQAKYNWGTAELFKWTTPRGFAAEGILYKPEDFDPNKKYPVIAYFYEIVTNGLHNYIPPTPTPSRLNISYFVSNGYIVLAPDIRYEIGYPGRSAEEYVNSGMRALSQMPWVDSTKLGIQGQSWGGYQVAHLITRTDMYAAAWSGAPVVNMTSAYGGIRWQTGRNRQFQYERTQSRLGATLWENLDLYLENSPLFYLDRVTTPVAIMHNDEDGAVPWYQGIEMFTALRRLGKPVWMLNYNGDAHNLVQRQNRKDIQRRQQQFFDHFLKGKPAAPWIEHGVPAVRKGIDWGFGDGN